MKLTSIVAAAAAMWLCGGVSATAQAAQSPTVRDFARQVRLSSPQLSPDGKTVALVEARAELESDEYRSEILLIELSSGSVRPLTRERHHASSPRWSPSGDRMAFIAPGSD